MMWHCYLILVHLYDEEKARALLKKVYDSLPSEHGIIIISEWLLNDEKTGPVPSDSHEFEYDSGTRERKELFICRN